MFIINQNRTCVTGCADEYPYEDNSVSPGRCVDKCGKGYYFVNETRRVCQSSCLWSDSFWYNTSFSERYTQCMPECQDYVPFHVVN